MAVNGICVSNVIKNNLTYNGSNILRPFNPRKSRVKITMVTYRGIFITLAPGALPVVTLGTIWHQVSLMIIFTKK
jgi:hypothetical protein